MNRLTAIALGLVAPALFALALVGLLLAHQHGFVDAPPRPEVWEEPTPGVEATTTDTTASSGFRVSLKTLSLPKQ